MKKQKIRRFTVLGVLSATLFLGACSQETSPDEVVRLYFEKTSQGSEDAFTLCATPDAIQFWQMMISQMSAEQQKKGREIQKKTFENIQLTFSKPEFYGSQAVVWVQAETGNQLIAKYPVTLFNINGAWKISTLSLFGPNAGMFTLNVQAATDKQAASLKAQQLKNISAEKTEASAVNQTSVSETSESTGSQPPEKSLLLEQENSVEKEPSADSTTAK